MLLNRIIGIQVYDANDCCRRDVVTRRLRRYVRKHLSAEGVRT
jgi:hypothetical protein